MPTLLVLGATSGIARATARCFAAEGWTLWLAARDVEAARRLAAELPQCSGETLAFAFDALQPETHAALWNSLPACPDAVLCAVGLLDDQLAARHDPELADRVLRTNFTGLVPVLSLAADAFEQRGRGVIVGISSVAGERGRASNYIYGSAKAGFTAFLSGLRNRLCGSGVQVLTVKPGYVDTAMTAGRRLPPVLTAQPEDVARDILNAVKGGRQCVYSKGLWRWIMGVTRLLPERVFMRTRF